MDKIWQESSTMRPQYENIVKILNFEIQDGRRPLFWKNTKNSITPKIFDRLSQNFNLCLVPPPRKRFWGQMLFFVKSKMAAGLRLKFTNIAITSKRLVQNRPNLP